MKKYFKVGERIRTVKDVFDCDDDGGDFLIRRDSIGTIVDSTCSGKSWLATFDGHEIFEDEAALLFSFEICGEHEDCAEEPPLPLNVGERAAFEFEGEIGRGTICHVFEEGFIYDDGAVQGGFAYMINLDSDRGEDEGLTVVVGEEYLIEGGE